MNEWRACMHKRHVTVIFHTWPSFTWARRWQAILCIRRSNYTLAIRRIWLKLRWWCQVRWSVDEVEGKRSSLSGLCKILRGEIQFARRSWSFHSAKENAFRTLNLPAFTTACTPIITPSGVRSYPLASVPVWHANSADRYRRTVSLWLARLILIFTCPISAAISILSFIQFITGISKYSTIIIKSEKRIRFIKPLTLHWYWYWNATIFY